MIRFLVWGSIALLLLALVVFGSVPGLIPRKTYGPPPWRVCGRNISFLVTAVEMYLARAGNYPRSLRNLTPQHIESIPTCPSAHADTYSPGYVYSTTNKAFTIVCSGHHHRDVGFPPDYPQYVMGRGIVYPSK